MQLTPAQVKLTRAFCLHCIPFPTDCDAHIHPSQIGRSIPPESKECSTQATLDNNRDEVIHTPTTYAMHVAELTCRSCRPYDTIAPIRSPKMKYAESMCDGCRFDVPFPITIVTLVSTICYEDISLTLFLLCLFSQSCAQCGVILKSLCLAKQNEIHTQSDSRCRIFDCHGTSVAIVKHTVLRYTQTDKYDYVYCLPDRRNNPLKHIRGTVETTEACSQCQPILPITIKEDKDTSSQDEVNLVDLIDIDPDTRRTCSLCDMATSNATKCMIMPSSRMIPLMPCSSAPFYFCEACLIRCEECHKPNSALIDGDGSYCDQCYAARHR